MSPLWRDETGIHVGPGRIVLARMSRGIRPSLVCEKGTRLDKLQTGDWRPALRALAAELDDERWQDANARVLISDHWVRYASLPWSDEITREDERITQARLLLGHTYGDLSEQWTIRISGNRPRSAALVSALPTNLLDEIREILQSRNLRPISIQPNLVASFNRWRGHVTDESAWFASVDDGSLATIRLRRGRYDQVDSLRTSGDWAVELKRLRTMSLLSEHTDGRLFVDVAGGAEGDSDECVWLYDEKDPGDTTSAVLAARGNY